MQEERKVTQVSKKVRFRNWKELSKTEKVRYMLFAIFIVLIILSVAIPGPKYWIKYIDPSNLSWEQYTKSFIFFEAGYTYSLISIRTSIVGYIILSFCLLLYLYFTYSLPFISLRKKSLKRTELAIILTKFAFLTIPFVVQEIYRILIKPQYYVSGYLVKVEFNYFPSSIYHTLFLVAISIGSANLAFELLFYILASKRNSSMVTLFGITDKNNKLKSFGVLGPFIFIWTLFSIGTGFVIPLFPAIFAWAFAGPRGGEKTVDYAEIRRTQLNRLKGWIKLYGNVEIEQACKIMEMEREELLTFIAENVGSGLLDVKIEGDKIVPTSGVELDEVLDSLEQAFNKWFEMEKTGQGKKV